MSSFSLAEALKKSRPQRPGQLQSPPRVLTMRNSHSEPAHMTMRRRNDEVVSIPTRPWHSPSRDQGAATLSNLSPSFSLDPPNFLRNLQRQCQMSRSFAQQKLSLASIIGGAMLQPSDCDESKSAGTLAGISDTISLDASVSHHFLCERSARIGRSGNCSNSTHRNWLSRRLGGSKRRRRHRRLDCNIQGNGDREGCGGWLQVPDIQALDDRKPCKAARSPQKPLPAQMQMLHQRQQQQQQIVKCATMLGGGQYHCGGGAQHYIRSTNISGQSANSNCLADQRSPSRHSDRNELEFGREDLKVCGHWQESLSNDDQNTTEASGTEDENRTRMAGVGSDLSSLTLSRMELSSSQAAATEQYLLQQQQQLQLQQRPRRFGGVDIGCTTTPASTGASEVTSSRSQQRQLQHQQQQFVLQQLQNAQQVQQRQGHHVVLPNVLEPHQLIAAQQLMVGVNYDQQQLNQQQLNQQQHQQQQLNQQQLNQQQHQQQQLNQQQLNQQQLNQQQLNQQQLNQQQQYQQYQLMQQSSSMYQDHSKGMTMTNQLHWQHQQPSNLQQYVPPNQQQQATLLPDQLPDQLPKRSRQHHLLQQQQHQHYQRHPHHLGVGRSSRHPAVGMNSSSSSYSLSQSQRSTRESNSGRDEEAIPASDDLVHLSVISCTEGGDGGGGGGGVGGGGTSEAEATTTPAAETEGEGEAGTTLCAESDDHRVPCSVVSTDQRNQQQQLQQQQQQQQQLDKQPKHQQQPQEQHQHQQQPKSERLLSAAESQRSSRYGRLKTPEICKRDFLSMLRQNISHGRLNRRAKMKLSGRL